MAGLVALVRHGDAGDRAEWDDIDILRPLTRKGVRQAEMLVRVLGGISFERLVSSPYLRCVQTLEPLARALTLPIEPNRALAEGAPVGATLELFRKLGDASCVLCSHGDVVGSVCEVMVASGVISEDQVKLRKASTWLLRTERGTIVQAGYIPPPRS
jgi:8-oxo-dGTP diphosphatase